MLCCLVNADLFPLVLSMFIIWKKTTPWVSYSDIFHSSVHAPISPPIECLFPFPCIPHHFSPIPLSNISPPSHLFSFTLSLSIRSIFLIFILTSLTLVPSFLLFLINQLHPVCFSLSLSCHFISFYSLPLCVVCLSNNSFPF